MITRERPTTNEEAKENDEEQEKHRRSGIRKNQLRGAVNDEGEQQNKAIMEHNTNRGNEQNEIRPTHTPDTLEQVVESRMGEFAQQEIDEEEVDTKR